MEILYINEYFKFMDLIAFEIIVILFNLHILFIHDHGRTSCRISVPLQKIFILLITTSLILTLYLVSINISN